MHLSPIPRHGQVILNRELTKKESCEHLKTFKSSKYNS